MWSQECDEYAELLENKFTYPILSQIRKYLCLLHLYQCKSDRSIEVRYWGRKVFRYKKFKDILMYKQLKQYEK
jgi:hypothetical protein